MSVRALLRTKPSGVITVGSAASVGEAAGLLLEHGIGGLPVVDEHGALIGFVSERDMVGLVHRDLPGARDVDVGSIMRSPAPVCAADDPIQQVMERMTRDRLRHLVVMDGERMAAVISVGDLVKHRLDEVETEAGVLRDYVAGQRVRG